MAMYRTEAFTSPLCRISYAQGLHKPSDKDNPSDNDRFSVTLIFPKSEVEKLRAAVAEVVQNQWGEKGVERFKNGLIKNPILAGDGKSAYTRDGELKDGMGPDVVFIRTTSGRPTPCFDQNVQPMDAKSIISGHWGKAVLNALAWHNPKNGDGVSFGLDMWQHVKADTSLGGGGAGDPNAFFSKEKVDTSESGPSGDKGGAADMFG